MLEGHPSLFDLEAHHAGEGSVEVAAHAASCATCRGYLGELERGAAAFAAAAQPLEFARQIAARAGAATARASRSRPSSWRVLLPGGALVAAALGAWLLLPRSALYRTQPGAGDPRADQVLVKGPSSVELSLILLRKDEDGQHREQGPLVTGRAGDRFRIELRVAAATDLEVVLLEPGAAPQKLSPARRFEPGSHILEPTFTFDRKPTRARLLAGPPAAVERAVTSGAPEPGVAAVAIASAGESPAGTP
jgi:hypothetical protein